MSWGKCGEKRSRRKTTVYVGGHHQEMHCDCTVQCRLITLRSSFNAEMEYYENVKEYADDGDGEDDVMISAFMLMMAIRLLTA